MLYTNPILYGDYSDPDVIRVGEDFYMISSSFTYVPGIPVLHSRDLVHWEIVGYAAQRLPFARYDRPGFFCLNTAGCRGGYTDVQRVSITRKNAGNT